jgi:4-carboxymuconolactone decarboxylase
MAKLEPVDLEKRADVAEIVDGVKKSRGWISNLMLSISHAPGALHHYARLGHYVRYETKLSEIERELVIVTTVRGVPYGWKHHGGLAREVGVSEAQLAELKASRVPADLSAPHRALAAFVIAFSAYKGVPQKVLDDLRAHYTAEQIVDIAMASAYYIAAGALIVGFEVEAEPPESFQLEIDWQRQRMGK